MNANLRIWNAVEKTNPEFTSKVAQRGGFTSIDAMYNIKRATEVFGPVGEGWAYCVDHSTIDLGTNGMLAVADVVIHHGQRRVENDGWTGDLPFRFGPIRGTHPLVSKDGRVDDDAPKKAMTDALTKGLSHLGFSADVFLGLHDDNKYVAKLTREFAPPAEVKTPAAKEPADADSKLAAARKWADTLADVVAKIEDLTRLESFWTSSARVYKFLQDNDRERAILASGTYARRKEALLNQPAQAAE